MKFKHLKTLSIVFLSVIAPVSASDAPIMDYEERNNEIVQTKTFVPTGSVVKFRVKSMEKIKPGTLRVAVTDTAKNPLKIKDDKVAMWKLLGAGQQEEVSVPSTQRLMFTVAKYRPGTKLYKEKLFEPWSAEGKNIQGDTNALEFREPTTGDDPAEKGNVVIEVKIIPPKF